MFQILLNPRARRNPRGHLAHLPHFLDEERETRESELNFSTRGGTTLYRELVNVCDHFWLS